MNVTKHTGKTISQFLPHTAAELSRIAKATQPMMRNNRASDYGSMDRYHAMSMNPIHTYTSNGKIQTHRNKNIGTQIDINA